MASKYTIKCQEYINYTQVKSGSYAASVSSTVRSDAYNESASRVYAQAKYNSYSVNLSSTGATNKGGSESSTDLARVGSTYSRSKSTPSYTYQYSYDGIDYYTTCTASFTASATRRSYCTYLKFTRPTNINANDIASATLKFTPADASSTDTEYILAALNNTSSMYIDDFSNLNSQQITIHGTGEKTIDITNLFKQWMNLGGTTGYFYFGSDVTTWRSFQFPDSATNVIIEYTVAYTNVTTDSRGATVSPSGIQKPGTPYTVSWYAGAAGEGNPIKLAFIDYGAKYGIIKSLVNRGCEVKVYPANVDAASILNGNFDAVFLSNGPGDPQDCKVQIATLKELFGKMPIFGICLGYQLLSIVAGAKTFKLKYGHRGGNHPVINLKTNKVMMSSQNHGYAVEESSLSDIMEVTYKNLNDGTLEGFKIDAMRVHAVQFHPEAAPGPNDAAVIFDEWVELMKEYQKVRV